MEGVQGYADRQVHPFGVIETADGGVVRARTYLEFPVNVLPLGTEIVQATLYAYVDSISNAGQGTFAVYRVVESWDEQGWTGDVDGWAALLDSPIASVDAIFDVMTSTLQQPTASPTASPTSSPTVAGQGTPTATTTPMTATPTLASSPLETPTVSPSPTASATPEPTVAPLDVENAVAMTHTVGGWVSWDVTVLMRAWLEAEIDNQGLAIASGPGPDVMPDRAGQLLVARRIHIDDQETAPYIIAKIDVYPVTPTPTAPVSPLLPPAGRTTAGGGPLVPTLLSLLGGAMFLVGAVLSALRLRNKQR
jgi:hypothetical protein